MLKKVFRALFIILGVVLGYIIGASMLEREAFSFILKIKGNPMYEILFILLITILSGIIFLGISPMITSAIIRLMDYIERGFQKTPVTDVIFGAVGAIIGLLITTLFFSAIKSDNLIWTIMMIITNIIMAALGADILTRKRDEIVAFFESLKKNSQSFVK